MSVLDQIQKFWSDLLALMTKLVIPDWPGLIQLLPVLVLIGVVGPLLSLAVLAWLGYGVTKPRTKVTYDEGTRIAPRDHLGRIIAPEGEPYCPRDGLIYPFGTTRCDRDKSTLLLRCPKCDVVREASISSCGNCGLTLSLQPRAMIVANDGPPPGGAAIA
ncbi:MAG TPA: hypothetical protein VHS36_10560 [Candidatus Limnocylindrales bacterium]|nr:hypothetical protein [Candidatus Limnocylindrales bacterium]